MNKLNRLIVPRLGNVVVVAALIASLSITFFRQPYWKWEPLDGSMRVNGTLNLLTFLAFLIATIAIWFTSLRAPLKIMGFILALPFLCISSLNLIFGPKQLLGSVEMGSYRYHLVTGNWGDSWDVYDLYRCYIVGENCEPIESFSLEGAAHHDIVDLVAEPSTDKIYVFKNGHVVFTYDASFQHYESLDDIAVGEYAYQLVSNPKQENEEVILSRCRQNSYIDCEVLFSSIVATSTKGSKLSFDDENRTLQVLVDNLPLFMTVVP